MVAKNEVGGTPLHHACEQGHEALALVLVKTGADTEAKNRIGRTPLLVAVAYGHEALALGLRVCGWMDVKQK